MKQMRELPFPSIMHKSEDYKLDDDYILSDKNFSTKEDCIAKKGETVTLIVYPNYGIVKHAQHGMFRY